MASYTVSSWRLFDLLLLSRAEFMGVESRGWQASQKCCSKAAPVAISEASVNNAKVADGSWWARSVARERLALQSSKAWTIVCVQSTGWDPLTLGPTNARWNFACMLAVCMNRREKLSMPKKSLRSLTNTGWWKRSIAAPFSSSARVPADDTVTEESHFRRAENTFCWIKQDTVLVETLEQCTQVLLVLFLRGRDDQYIIYMRNKNRCFLGPHLWTAEMFATPEGKAREFEKAEWRDDGCFAWCVAVLPDYRWRLVTWMACITSCLANAFPPDVKSAGWARLTDFVYSLHFCRSTSYYCQGDLDPSSVVSGQVSWRNI